jgi:hypothetical protein
VGYPAQNAHGLGRAIKRKKPISQAEQSRRFLEAAREAGVDTRDQTLARIVRKISKTPAKKAKKASRGK